MNIIDHWKHGFGILVRLLFLLAVLSVGLAPVLFLEDPFRSSGWGFLLSTSYFLIVLPFLLPWFFEIAGLKVTKQSEIEDTAGINDSSIIKQKELRNEHLGEIGTPERTDHHG